MVNIKSSFLSSGGIWDSVTGTTRPRTEASIAFTASTLGDYTTTNIGEVSSIVFNYGNYIFFVSLY